MGCQTSSLQLRPLACEAAHTQSSTLADAPEVTGSSWKGWRSLSTSRGAAGMPCSCGEPSSSPAGRPASHPLVMLGLVHVHQTAAMAAGWLIVGYSGSWHAPAILSASSACEGSAPPRAASTPSAAASSSAAEYVPALSLACSPSLVILPACMCHFRTPPHLRKHRCTRKPASGGRMLWKGLMALVAWQAGRRRSRVHA